MAKDKKNSRIIINLKEQYYCVLAFFISALTMYMMLSYSGVLTTGKNCILEGDSLEIYIPTIQNFIRSILQGQRIYYSWNNSLGMNTSLSLAYYNVFNPLNIIFFIFHKADPNIPTAIIIIIKTGLAALSFQLFSKYFLHVSDLKSIIFAIAYSMCGFQVTCNIINFIWMDALYVLPIVFLSIYLLSQKGNPIPLIISYSFIFLTQFYMGYIIGIISFLFFFVGIWCFKHNISKKKYITLFILSVIISILISAVVWMPAAWVILHNRGTDTKQFDNLPFNIIDIYNQLFFGNNSLHPYMLPNVYCGVITVIFFPLFFLNRKIDNKQKILFGILILFTLLSCIILPLYIIWHAFDAPDGWAFRFSYVLSFLLLSIATKEFDSIKETNKKYFFITLILNSLLYLAEILWLGKRAPEQTINTLTFAGINIFLMIMWIILVINYINLQQKSNDKKKITGILSACILLICLECTANGYCAYYRGNSEYGLPSTQEYFFYKWNDNQQQLMQFLSNDKSLYRVNYVGDIIKNGDSYSGYNGLSDFNTSENPKVRLVMSKLGFETATTKIVRNYGITDYTKMLLGVKYDVRGEKANLFSTEAPELLIQENPYALSFGFMVNTTAKEVKLSDSNAFENNNHLFSSLLNKDISVFDNLETDDYSIEEHGIKIIPENEYYILLLEDETNSNPYLKYQITSNAPNTYIYFENLESISGEKSMLLNGGEENISETSGLLSMSYIKQFEPINNNTESNGEVIITPGNARRQVIQGYDIATINYDSFEEVYGELSSNPLKIKKFGNGYINGTINITSDDKLLLFTTIPFDPGWKIKVNNHPTEYFPILNDAFIGVQFNTPGLYEIEMSFVPKWLREGGFLSVIGLIAFIIIFIQFRPSIGINKKAFSSI